MYSCWHGASVPEDIAGKKSETIKKIIKYTQIEDSWYFNN